MSTTSGSGALPREELHPGDAKSSYSRLTPVSQAERLRLERQAERYSARLLARAIGALRPTLESVSIGDFGCGYGAAIPILAREIPASIRDRHYIAIDEHRTRLNCALEIAQLYGFSGFGVRARLGDDPINVSPRGVDLAIASFLFTHSQSLEKTSLAIAKATREGGLLAVADADYREACAFDDPALIETLIKLQPELQSYLRKLDMMLARSGFFLLHPFAGRRRTDAYGSRYGSSAKYDGLGFIAHFDPMHPARQAWEQIKGGVLYLPRVEAIFIKRGAVADARTTKLDSQPGTRASANAWTGAL